MQYHIITIALLFLTLAGCSRTDDANRAALQQLDDVIGRRPQYEAQRRAVIDSLNHALTDALTDSARFAVNGQLFTQYSDYNMDTALTVALRCAALAPAQRNSQEALWRSQLMIAEALKGMGAYSESRAVLDSLPQFSDPDLRFKRLNRYCSLYMSLYEATYPRPEAEVYRQRIQDLRDSLVAISTPGTWTYCLNRAERMKMRSEDRLALQEYEAFARNAPASELARYDAVRFHLMGEAYAKLGMRDSAVYFLARSAIADLRQCTKKYKALPQLAYILSENGDSERAYHYITRSLNDIKECNARSRVYQIADMLPVINRAFDEGNTRSQRNRLILLGVILSAAMATAFMALAIKKRNRKLAQERLLLSDKKAELEEMKTQLDQLVCQLEHSNARLEESNLLKEQYIGYLFSEYAGSVDSNIKFRQSLQRLLRVGKPKDIEQAVMRNEVNDVRQRGHLRHFDDIFIDIFPNFVEQFNTLLTPEGRIYPPKGEVLTPELRIFALMRLGITDNALIAAFLGYSVQTVYNYSQRVRNNALDPDRKTFAALVRSLKAY